MQKFACNSPRSICFHYYLRKHLLINVNNSNTRKMGEMCSKLKINARDWRHGHRSDVFIVNFEHVSHFLLVLLLLALIKEILAWIIAKSIFENNQYPWLSVKFWKICDVFGPFVHDDHEQKLKFLRILALNSNVWTGKNSHGISSWRSAKRKF